jgi:hypothetical protein
LKYFTPKKLSLSFQKYGLDPDPQKLIPDPGAKKITGSRSVADPDPGLGAFLTPGSGMGESQHPGSGMNNPDHIF